MEVVDVSLGKPDVTDDNATAYAGPVSDAVMPSWRAVMARARILTVERKTNVLQPDHWLQPSSICYILGIFPQVGLRKPHFSR